MGSAMTNPRNLHLSQQMLQNLEALQLPIEELRARIEKELRDQESQDKPEDPKT